MVPLGCSTIDCNCWISSDDGKGTGLKEVILHPAQFTEKTVGIYACSHINSQLRVFPTYLVPKPLFLGPNLSENHVMRI